MPPKRCAPAKASSSEPKRKRKMMTISEKVKLLDMIKEGRRGLNEVVSSVYVALRPIRFSGLG
ncbi:hypothetical protein E2C01_027323 [Portunus trituberculatus]|uniref:HTH psq-type domain-containing protein n=1 Tax=Portunus trituberculatus TaxID=210409 RepID=A0A5B7ELM2_PORTR|nr:hypothetical protein [Portunus trituberculatus]